MIDAFAKFRTDFDTALQELANKIVADVNTSRNSVATEFEITEEKLTEILNRLAASDTKVAALLTRLTAAEAEIAKLKAGSPTNPTPADPAPTDPVPQEPTLPSGDILYSKSRILSRPTTGAPWDRLLARAKGTWTLPSLGNNNAQGDSDVVAGAIVAVRLNDSAMRTKVIEQLKRAIVYTRVSSEPRDGTNALYRTLELGRGLHGYVIAANLIGYAEKAFVDWVHAMVTFSFPKDGGTHSGLQTILATALTLNSNWATQCRRSVVAAAMYLSLVGSDAQKADAKKWLTDAVESHKRDIGVPGSYPTLPPFKTDPTGWSGDANPVVGINPAGTTKVIGGVKRNLDGARPADWRRAKTPSGSDDVAAEYWPPKPVTYHWEGIGPQVVLGMILHEHGLVPFNSANNALVRALNALYGRVPNDPPFINPASGDDRSIPWIVNYYAKTNFPTTADETPDKAGIGWMDWYLG